jgi:hypothetical protein
MSLGVITKTFPLERVRAVLAATGKTSLRERNLPAHVVVYYAIALALYMHSSYREVLRCLLEGLLMAHFAVRALMHEAALKANEDPDRLSFLHAVRVVRRKLAAFNAIAPVLRKSFHERVLEEILQERVDNRRGRQNTRCVKRKMSNWPPSRGRAKSTQSDNVEKTIQLVK